jgi:manganese/zinc/iron transport system permease protein
MTPVLSETLQWYWELDGWIVAAGVLSAVSCALLGNFLVLRRMSMMGDAISHAVLPGIAIAFLIFESRGAYVMFVGAVVAGMLTALFTQWVHSMGKVEQSASMGVVFTSLFAVGLILIVRALDHVDLDPGCVLYGAIETVPMQMHTVFGAEIPRAVLTLAPVLVLNVLFVIGFFKELKISSFDPALATTMGVNASLMHYLLMTLVAATTVASFESVGSILVIAMLIVPAAAAHLLTDRLATMIVLSALLAAASAVIGHVSALTVPRLFGFTDTSTAGMMAVAAGAIFAVVMLGAPRYGLISAMYHRARLSGRINREDALGFMYRLEELGVPPAPAAALVRQLAAALDIRWLSARRALRRLERIDLLERARGACSLTPAGREAARGLVRSHRLWESYLVKHLGLRPDHVHGTAMVLEHVTGDEMQQKLARGTGDAAVDPHGQKIPPADGSDPAEG